VRLHVLPDCTVVGNQLLEYEVGGTGERLVLVLHAADRLERLTRGACRQDFAGDEHGSHRGETEDQPPADA